jgi:hypothetical protein
VAKATQVPETIDASAAPRNALVGIGATPRPEEIHAAHIIPPALSAAHPTASARVPDRPTARTTSATTRPNNRPEKYGVAPVKSYSPRINAPTAAAPAPTTNALA